MSFREETVSVRGGAFETLVRSGGQGDPLVFLHGVNVPSPSEPFLELLARDYMVYQPVHPGWPGSTGLEHIDDVVDLALYYCDLFDALGLGPVHLVGSSLGGMFAAEVAALGRQYVRKLVLSDAAGLWLDNPQPLDIFTAAQDALTQAMYFDPERAATQQPQPESEDAEARAQATLQRAMSLSAAGKFMWPIWDKGLKKRIHRINAPTLIVWGEHDGVTPPPYGELFHRLIPGSRLVTIKESAHLPMAERPEEFVQTVRDFLEEP